MSQLAQLGLVIVLFVGAFLWIGWLMKRREQRWESDEWRRGGSSARVGNALLEVQSLLEPDRRHALEERRRSKRDDEDLGDPPTAGDDSDVDRSSAG